MEVEESSEVTLLGINRMMGLAVIVLSIPFDERNIALDLYEFTWVCCFSTTQGVKG